MSKKSPKIEEIVEALCDERVSTSLINRIQDKLITDINATIELKLKELVSDLTTTLTKSISDVAADAIKKATTPIYQEIESLDHRVNQLDQQSVQNELFVYGLKDKASPQNVGIIINPNGSTENWTTVDLLINYLNLELDIQLERRDINFAYRTRKKSVDPNFPSPILVNFISVQKRNEVLLKVKQLRKDPKYRSESKPVVFFNERLTKLNSEISYKARQLQKNKKIASTWIFRGETYIRKDQSSKPQRILNLADLNYYN